MLPCTLHGQCNSIAQPSTRTECSFWVPTAAPASKTHAASCAFGSGDLRRRRAHRHGQQRTTCSSFAAGSHSLASHLSTATVHANSAGRQRLVTRAADSSGDYAGSSTSSSEGRRHVLVLGGTGRVGSSTAASLIQRNVDVDISLAGRRQESFDKAVKARPELSAAKFCQCDIEDNASLAQALKGVGLVIHAAGPFQRCKHSNVLDACIEAGVPYLDVCDDTECSQVHKRKHDKAQAAGVPCITTAGIYPGTSNIMAAHMISMAKKEYNDDWSYRDTPGEGGTQPKRLRYSYFTAGSGGVGPTILETSMLLAGTEVVAYKDGHKIIMPPVSGLRVVDFGIGLGRKTLFLYNLPEVHSANQVMQVPAVSARFGTSPDIWNWAMWLTARLSPPNFLTDRSKAKWLARLAAPWVALTDKFSGEKVAMLVEVEMENDVVAAGLFMHKLLSDSVGHSVAAFAMAMLDGETEPGVWFPEEREAIKDRRGLLQRANKGCQRFELNRPTWALESNPRQLGFGIYW